jgi:REP element-mobilizing transposase RayT
MRKRDFGRTSSQLRFWNDGYSVRSVGGKVTPEVIRRYINLTVAKRTRANRPSRLRKAVVLRI